MSILYLHVPHFLASVEEAAHPELAGQPLVVGGLPHERRPVHDASPRAAAQGIRRGMPLREAQERCPQAVFLPLRRGVYERVNRQLLRLLERFSPVVEMVALGAAYLDVSGTGRLWGEPAKLLGQVEAALREELGLAVQLGLAPNRFGARVAGLCARPGEPLAFPPHRLRESLAPLPIRFLPVPGEIRQELEALGLHSLGQIACLAPGSLAWRFGADGPRLHALAAGMDARPLIPSRWPLVLRAGVLFEDPVAALPPLLRSAERLLSRLLRRLRAEFLLCREVGVRLVFEEASLQRGEARESGGQLGFPGMVGQAGAGEDPGRLSLTLREPTAEPAVLLRAVRALLERPGTAPREVRGTIPQKARGAGAAGARRPAYPGPVVELHLRLAALGGPASRQLVLLHPSRRPAEGVRRLQEELVREFGARRIRQLSGGEDDPRPGPDLPPGRTPSQPPGAEP